MWGFMWGFGVECREACETQTHSPGRWSLSRSLPGLGCVVALLAVRVEQIEFFCPMDGRPAVVDPELVVNVFGVGAHRAQGDHEFTGDLRASKSVLSKPQHFKLTLAEWLDQSAECGGGGLE